MNDCRSRAGFIASSPEDRGFILRFIVTEVPLIDCNIEALIAADEPNLLATAREVVKCANSLLGSVLLLEDDDVLGKGLDSLVDFIIWRNNPLPRLGAAAVAHDDIATFAATAIEILMEIHADMGREEATAICKEAEENLRVEKERALQPEEPLRFFEPEEDWQGFDDEVLALTETAPERDAYPAQGSHVALGDAFNYRGEAAGIALEANEN